MKKKRPESTNLGGAPDDEQAQAEIAAILAGPQKKKEEKEESDDDDYSSSEEEESGQEAEGEAGSDKTKSSSKGKKTDEIPIDWWAEFRSLIPGTQEYREDQKIMQQMSEDDTMHIEHIEWELQKCRRIERLMASGKWEVALQRLKQDLDFADFSEFQSAKEKQKKSGKWLSGRRRRRSDPRLKTMLGKFMIMMEKLAKSRRGGEEGLGGMQGYPRYATRRRPRSRRKEENSSSEEEQESEAVRIAREMERTSTFPVHKIAPNMICTWRWKVPGAEGHWYRCTNSKCMHMSQTEKDVYGCDRPVYMPFCKYHLKICCNDHGMLFVRVSEANEKGFCNECYVRSEDHVPLKLDPLTFPGVVREPKKRQHQPANPLFGITITTLTTTMISSKEEDEEERTETTICGWKPNRYNTEELNWQCGNRVFFNATTRSYEGVCSYHMPCCWMPHIDNDPRTTAVNFPNGDALCKVHFMAKHRRKPQLLRLPYPGMLLRKRRTHPLGPLESPRELVIYTKKGATAKGGQKKRRKNNIIDWDPLPAAVTQEEDGGKKTMSNLTLISRLALAMNNTIKLPRARPTIPPLLTSIDLRQLSTTATMQAKAMIQAASNPSSIDFQALSTTAKVQAKAMIQAAMTTTLNLPEVIKTQDIPRLFGLISEKRKLRAILTIQTAVRQHLAKQQRHRLWARRQAKRRLLAAIQLQAWVRAQMLRKTFSRKLSRHRWAVTTIAARWRGVMLRERRRCHQAACIITRALARNYGNMIKLTYIHLMHERRKINNKEGSMVFLQRVLRGFLGRRIAARHRLAAQKKVACIILVQKCFRGFRARLHVVRQRQHLQKMGRLALVLETFVRMTIWKMRMHKVMKRGMMNRREAIRRIQRFARLAVAKIRTRQMRMVVQGVWDLWNPQQLEKDFIVSMLARNRYGLLPSSPTTLAILEESFYQGPSRGETVMGKPVNQEIAKLLLSKDSRDWAAVLAATSSSIIDASLPHAKYFLELDLSGSGTLSREHFESAMVKMWEAAGNDLLQDEATALVKLFDVLGDGKRIHYRRFFAYAMQHTKVCADHGRYICGTCCSYAHCTKLIPSGNQCKCQVFKPHDDGKAHSMCGCGHSRAAHTVIPLVVQEEKEAASDIPIINEKKMLTSLQRQRRVQDISKQLIAQGTKVVTCDAVQHKKKKTTKQQEREHRERLEALTRERRLAWERETYDEWNARLRKAIKEGRFQDENRATAGEGLSMLFQDMDDLWPIIYREALYVHRPGVNADARTKSLIADSGNHSTRGLDPSQAGYIVPYFVQSLRLMRTEHEMVLASGVLPTTQSYDELKEGFKITVPIPLIARNELRLTTRPITLYFHLLKLLGARGSPLLESGEAFTNVVAHYFVFLRRFWKHLLKDIRRGRLSEYIEMTRARRQYIESQMNPNPEQAKKVERLLFLHGFHEMSSGKAKVVPPTFSDIKDDNAEERVKTAATAFTVLPNPPSKTSLFPEYVSPFRLKTLTRKVQEDTTRRVSAPSTMPLVIRPFSSGASQASSDRAFISTPRKVRGNVNDIDKVPLSNKEIFEIGYELQKQPLPHPLPTYDPYMRVDDRCRRRFVCGHPACGQSFTNHEILLQHQVSHNLHYRLGVATPETDQYMHKVWPDGAAWDSSSPLNNNTNNKLTGRIALHTPYRCPITATGCRRSFAAQKELLLHLRCGHNKFQLEKLGLPPISGVEWIDSPRLVPPFAPPIRAHVPICPIPSHIRPRFRCAQCRANKIKHGPKAPLKFYSRGKITMRDGSRLSVSFIDPESTACVEGMVKGGSKGLNPVHCAGLCEDRFGQAWIAFSRYLDGSTLRAEYGVKKLPKDFDRENELIQCLEVEWATIDCIKAYSYTLCCTGAEYRRLKQENSLPKGGASVKYCRYVFSVEMERVVGERVLPGAREDPYDCTGIVLKES